MCAKRYYLVRNIDGSNGISGILSAQTENPTIGFFWWLETEKGIMLPLVEVYNVDDIDMLEGTDHKKIWEEEKSRCMVNPTIAWNDLPRGRILWDFEHERHVVYAGVIEMRHDLIEVLKDVFSIVSMPEWEYNEHYDLGVKADGWYNQAG